MEKYTNYEISSISGTHKRLYIIMVVIYCYLKIEIDKILKFQVNNYTGFEITVSLF